LVCMGGVVAGAQKQPARPAITGISHVGLDEDDQAAAKKLYTDVVGWQSGPDYEHQDGLRFQVNSQQYVEIFPTGGNLQQPELDHVAYLTADADALLRYLRSKSVTVPAKVTKDSDGAKRFMVLDPEGNRVEFVQSTTKTAVAMNDHELGNQIIHIGFVVRNRDAEDSFYRDTLGFRLFWTGSMKDGKPAWIDMQMPEGRQWIEYMMLDIPADAPRAKFASPDHFSMGVVSLDDTVNTLNKRGYPAQHKGDGTPRDGKRKMNLLDPGGTRVEVMEYKPYTDVCCGGYLGEQPSAADVADTR